MSRDRPQLIELVGHPGAGKSTLVRAASLGLEMPVRFQLSEGWQQQGLASKISQSASCFADLSLLAAAWKFVRQATVGNGDSLRRLSRLLIKSQWGRRQEGRFLLQEGYLQELWSVLYSAGQFSPDPHSIAPLVKRLYAGLDGHIVLLELSAQQAVERIGSRPHGRSRFDQLSGDRLQSELDRVAQLPNLLAEAAEIAGLEVHRIDASQPVDAAAEQLRGIVRLL